MLCRLVSKLVVLFAKLFRIRHRRRRSQQQGGGNSGELQKQVEELKEQLKQKDEEIKELKARLQKYEE